MSAGELACTYACLALFDDGIPITAEKITTLVKSANVSVDAYWPSLFAKLIEKRDVEDLLMSIGSRSSAAVPVASSSGSGAAPPQEENEEKKEEPKEESDDDMGFSLFD